MVVKAPDVNLSRAARRLSSAKGTSTEGVWGMAPLQEIFKIEHSEMLFPAFLRQGWSSFKFSLK